MKKIQYITPELQVMKIGMQSIIAESNTFNGESANLNPKTMAGGDGGDAVKRSDYNVWDDDWSR